VTKSFKPVRHLLDPRNGTGIITEEESSKCSETSHKNASYVTLGGIGPDAPTHINWTTWHVV